MRPWWGTIGKACQEKRPYIYEEDENGEIKELIKAKKMFLKPQD